MYVRLCYIRFMFIIQNYGRANDDDYDDDDYDDDYTNILWHCLYVYDWASVVSIHLVEFVWLLSTGWLVACPTFVLASLAVWLGVRTSYVCLFICSLARPYVRSLVWLWGIFFIFFTLAHCVWIGLMLSITWAALLINALSVFRFVFCCR